MEVRTKTTVRGKIFPRTVQASEVSKYFIYGSRKHLVYSELAGFRDKQKNTRRITVSVETARYTYILVCIWQNTIYDMGKSRPRKQQLERSTTLPYNERFYDTKQDMLKPMFE